MPVRAVLLDFYGTLAREIHPVGIEHVMARHGYELAEPLRQMWWSGDIDGIEHLEQSRSREHYVAWQQERVLAMLAEADVHPGEYDVILDELHEGRVGRVMESYPEVPDTLRELRARGLRLAICSNWDWDLEQAVAESGLAEAVDVMVSSARVGARKPHPRIFRETLARLGATPPDVLFVGDTWGADVEGPLAFGMSAVYLEREDHWADTTMPRHAAAVDVPRVRDLAAVLALV